ncbi:hypothetical protein Tco_0853321 [Tanacetum coccineum]
MVISWMNVDWNWTANMNVDGLQLLGFHYAILGEYLKEREFQGRVVLLFSLTVVFPPGFYMGGFFKEANSFENANSGTPLFDNGRMDFKVADLKLLLMDWLKGIIWITEYEVQ